MPRTLCFTSVLSNVISSPEGWSFLLMKKHYWWEVPLPRFEPRPVWLQSRALAPHPCCFHTHSSLQASLLCVLRVGFPTCPHQGGFPSQELSWLSPHISFRAWVTLGDDHLSPFWLIQQKRASSLRTGTLSLLPWFPAWSRDSPWQVYSTCWLIG